MSWSDKSSSHFGNLSPVLVKHLAFSAEAKGVAGWSVSQFFPASMTVEATAFAEKSAGNVSFSGRAGAFGAEAPGGCIGRDNEAAARAQKRFSRHN